MRALLVVFFVAGFTGLSAGLANPEAEGRSPGSEGPPDQAETDGIAGDPQALRFGDPTPHEPGRPSADAADEPGFANFGPDVANQLLVMAAIVASSALIALRKRSGLVLGRNRQWRSRNR